MDASSADNNKLRESLGLDATGSVEMTESDLRQCMLAFRKFEVDGLFPVDRLKEALMAAQVSQEEGQVEKTIQSLLDRGVKAMEFYDFATLVCSKKGRRRKSTHSVLASIFQLLDRDSDGFISAAELKVSMETLLGERHSGDSAERMIRQLDTSGRGKVSYEEFVCMLNSSLGESASCFSSD